MQAIIEPKTFVAELKKAKLLTDFAVPESIVLYLPPGALPKNTVQLDPQVHSILMARLHKVMDQNVGIVTGLGVGAPSLVIILEMLIALGAKRFLAVGTAGTFDENIKIGDCVICEKAWRGDGTSVRYIEGEGWSAASPQLIDQAKILRAKENAEYRLVSAWTTDAFFRETKSEVERMQKKGVSVVEMESAALYAVAEFRRVEALSMFVISDQLAGPTWRPEFRGLKEGLTCLLNVALKSLNS